MSPAIGLPQVRMCSTAVLLPSAVGEDNIVRVEFIFEPEQSGTATKLELQRHTPQEAQVMTGS